MTAFSDYVEDKVLNRVLNSQTDAEWPEITEQQDPLPEADAFKDVEDKRELLDESPAPGG